MSKIQKQSTPAATVIEMFQSMQEAAFPSIVGSVPGIGTDWMDTMTNVGNEMMEFMATRVKTDVQTQNDLLQANGIAEIQEIQTQFFQKVMNDYAAESTKLMDMFQAAGPKDKSDALPV
jgi:hypothetical protein